jgi:hypothetical protein
MFLAQYRFAEVLGGFFEFPTDNARRLLPPHLEPIELHHGSSVLSMSVFDVVESPVGPHRSVALSVLVVPLLKDAGDTMPNSAFYPFLSGSTSAAGRQLAIEHLHIPHWTEDVAIEITRRGREVRAAVTSGGDAIADLAVSEHSWDPVTHLYQCFVKDATGAYMTNIHATGTLSEHEEESGKLELHDHPFHTGLSIADVYDVPLRQTILRDGVQSFEPLTQLQLA